MISIMNILSFATAALSFSTVYAAQTDRPASGKTKVGECGKVDIFYTGLPPYHPLVIEQGWDPARVEAGLRKDADSLVKAGYNVHSTYFSHLLRQRLADRCPFLSGIVVWAGPEVCIDTMEKRMASAGVEYDLVGIGFGIRGTTIEALVERFEGEWFGPDA